MLVLVPFLDVNGVICEIWPEDVGVGSRVRWVRREEQDPALGQHHPITDLAPQATVTDVEGWAVVHSQSPVIHCIFKKRESDDNRFALNSIIRDLWTHTHSCLNQQPQELINQQTVVHQHRIKITLLIQAIQILLSITTQTQIERYIYNRSLSSRQCQYHKYECKPKLKGEKFKLTEDK